LFLRKPTQFKMLQQRSLILENSIIPELNLLNLRLIKSLYKKKALLYKKMH